MSWFYLSYLILTNYRPDSIIISYIPTIVEYVIRLIVIVLLIIDFKKNNLKNVILACISTLFFPLLGIVIFSILLIESERKKANA